MGFRFLLLLCGSRLLWAQDLPPELEALLAKNHVNPSEISLVATPLEGSGIRIDWGGDTPRHPASVTKLLTTAAGLIALGPQYRWTTEFLSTGALDTQGVLQGPLYLKGEADPYWVRERLQALAAQWRAQGLRTIAGDLIYDQSYYPVQAKTLHDHHPFAPYNATPAPLMVNFHTVTVDYRPETGFTLSPNLENWHLVDHLKIQGRGCPKKRSIALKVTAQGEGGTITATGRYGKTCPPQSWYLALGDAGRGFAVALREALRAQGIRLLGKIASGLVPPNAHRFDAERSPPLLELIAYMNQESNNVMTRQLFLTLGAERFGRPSSLEKARAAVAQTLSDFGVDLRGVLLDNGAGLSRTTEIPAARILLLLQKIWYSPLRDDFMGTLSRAGEVGTLKRRKQWQGQLWGKTGTLRDVRALAGYFKTHRGTIYAFVLIGNGDSARGVRPFEDDFLKWLDQQRM